MTLSFHHRRSLMLVIGALFASTLPALGASATSATAEARKIGQARDDALTLVRTGNPAAAEVALANAVLSRPGSTRWHLELGRHLGALISTLASSGRTAEVRALANRALAHLQEVERDTSEPRLQASAHALSGSIYERYLGDHERAKASYSAAAERNPRDQQARRNLQRLEATAKRRKG